MTATETDTNLRNNDGQIQFWNTGPGKNWVRYQAGLDACFKNINARLIELCEMKSDGHALDVGCGTGATSIALAGKFGNQARITGVDISRPLLDHAAKRVESSDCKNIQFMEADVQTHLFKDNEFDLIASRFGVMFFTEPYIAFGNLAKALKPAASINFVSWSTVDSNPWFCIPRDAAVARLGKGAPSDPKAPGPTAFADTDYVHDILNQVGFTDINIEVENLNIETALNAEEMAELACNLGPAVRLMKEKNGSEADAREIRQAVCKSLGQFETKAGFSIPASIVVVRASRAI